MLPELVRLGVVERREVPPSSLFRIVPEHVVARLLSDLNRSAETIRVEMGRLVVGFVPPPVRVIVFGSFVRGDADAKSDVAVVVVRPVMGALTDDEPEPEVGIEPTTCCLQDSCSSH